MMANVNSPCDLIWPHAGPIEPPPVALPPPAEEMNGEEEHPASEAACLSLGDLLAIEREPSGAPPDVKFHDAGRDFHRPEIEVAVLSVCMNRPMQIGKVCRQLDAGDFYLEFTNALFEAILHVQNTSGSASPAAVLKFLGDVDPDQLPHWTKFVNECAATAANFRDLDRYISRLKEAAAIRGGKGYCPHGYSESFCAQLLILRLPPTRCIDKAWYQYREGCWTESDDNLVRTLALQVIHPSQREAKRVEGVIKHVEHALQVPRVSFFGAHRFIDGDRLIINTQNGATDVHAGVVQFLPHSPNYNFTRKLAAAFDAEAQCPLFLQVLSEAVPDPDDRVLFQAFCGYILQPNCDHETAMVLFGPGGTGKSTLAGTIGDLLGRELCGAAGLEELCKSGSYTLPTLKAKMLNLGSELNGTEIEESANFKKLVSGEWLSVRQIYAAPEDMQTTCKLLFLTNNMPRFRGGTDAETRRLRILHFGVQPKNKDPKLKEKLRGELAGILNWMLEGLLLVLQNKTIPFGGTTTRRLMESFHRGNDPVGAFVRECCDLGPKLETVKKSLCDAFAAWCEEAGLPADRLENFFFKTLLQRYPDLKSTRRTFEKKREHCLAGIGLKDSAPWTGEDVVSPLKKKEWLAKLKAKDTRV